MPAKLDGRHVGTVRERSRRPGRAGDDGAGLVTHGEVARRRVVVVGEVHVVARRVATEHLHAQFVELFDRRLLDRHGVPRRRHILPARLPAAPRRALRRAHRRTGFTWAAYQLGDHHDPVGDRLRLVVVMGDDQRRGALGAQDRPEVVDEPVVQLAVEAGQRLVEEQHAG